MHTFGASRWRTGLATGLLVLLALHPGEPLAAQSASVTDEVALSLARSIAVSARLRADPVAHQGGPRGISFDFPFAQTKDHRWKGAAIGAVVGALALTLVGLQFCYEDCGVKAVGSVMLGGAIGGFVGLLIGGAIPKETRPPGDKEP